MTLVIVSLLFAAAPADPGADVLRVFSARCVSCHGADVKNPKDGQFLYILDLKRLAADQSKVVPGDPAKSALWLLVDASNMPPNNSPTGSLNDTQKAAVKAWIVAGAPDALPVVAPVSPVQLPAKTPAPPIVPADPPPSPVVPDVAPSDLDSSGGSTPSGASESLVQHLGRWTGEMHLLLLHFPIVCLIAAGVAEGRAMFKGRLSASTTTTFCLWIAAAAVVPTVVCGWIHAAAGHGAVSDALPWHRWLGTVGGVVTVLTAIVHSHGGVLLVPVQHAMARRSFLGMAAALVVAAAHFGGKMAFGANFLGW